MTRFGHQRRLSRYNLPPSAYFHNTIYPPMQTFVIKYIHQCILSWYNLSTSAGFHNTIYSPVQTFIIQSTDQTVIDVKHKRNYRYGLTALNPPTSSDLDNTIQPPMWTRPIISADTQTTYARPDTHMPTTAWHSLMLIIHPAGDLATCLDP